MTTTHASNECAGFHGVKLNGFVGDTVESLSQSLDCSEKLKTSKYNVLAGQAKSDFCSCSATNPKSVTGNSLLEIKKDPNFKKNKIKLKKEIEEKYAKSIRSKILGTLSRSFNFDNLAKRGYLSNSLARDKGSNKCNLDHMLGNIGNFASFSDANVSCRGKDRLFAERKRLLFPEGEEAFIQNLKDTANTIAKGVRANGSCLTYQNYLELNSTIPKNSEAVKILQASKSWEDFKSKVADELSTFNRYKNNLNKVRNAENSDAVANKLWGFSGLEGRGKEVYRMLKANPSFELALRDKDHFLKMQRELNLFESDLASGGFAAQPHKANDPNEFFNKNSEQSLQAHLKSCDNDVSPQGRGGRGGGATSKSESIGLKQSIAKFLCDEELPLPRYADIDNLSDLKSRKSGNEEDVFRSTLKSDLICESKVSYDPVFFSDIDSLTTPASDIDLSDAKNFLSDYKDFSSSFCKMIKKECTIPSEATKDDDCNSLTEMANDATRFALREFITLNKVSPAISARIIGFLNHPKFDDDTAFKKMRELITQNTNPPPSDKDFNVLFEKLSLLRQHNGKVRFYRELDTFKNALPKDIPEGREYDYMLSSSGRNYLKHLPSSPEGRRLLGVLAQDTSLKIDEDISNSIFADVFTNGHESSGENGVKLPRYISSGPAVDTDYLTKTTEPKIDPDNPINKMDLGVVTKPLDGNTIRTSLGTGMMPRGTGFNPKSLPRDLSGGTTASKDQNTNTTDISTPATTATTTDASNSSTKIRSLDDLLSRAVPPQVNKDNKDIVIVSSPDTPKDQDDTKKASAPSDTGETGNSNSWSNSVEQFGLTRTSKDTSEDMQGSRINYDTRLSYDESDSLSKSGGSERIGGFGKMFDSNQSEKEKILAEIRDLEAKIKERRDGQSTNNDEISNAESVNNQLKRRVADLENQINNRSNSNNYNSRNFDNQNYGSNNNDTDSNGNNNIDPRDPFSRVDTSREITADHMDEIDPAGQSAKSGGGGSGKKAIGLSKNKTSTPENEADLGGKSTKKRKPASAEYELDPELICGFEQQELNCIFEHSEIFARYKKDQIKSLVEGLLLHGHSFKTIEMFRNRDPNIPNEYVIHYFEPAKNLSNEDKMAQFELVKKMMTDYKKNYSFLKAIASKVVRTKSIKINKKEAFSKMKNTLKRPDIDKLLIRRLKLIERLPANTKK